MSTPNRPSRLSDRAAEALLLEQLRKLAASGKPLDLVKADAQVLSGLPAQKAEEALKGLSREYRSHLMVTEQGELVYHFAPGLVRRDARTLTERFERALLHVGNALFTAFKLGFKVWISLTLVLYTIVFALLGLALTLSGNDDDGPGALFLWWLLPDFGSARRRALDDLPARPRKRFYRSVFDFVFGPEPDREAARALPPGDDREVLAHLRENQGRITATDLVLLKGCDYATAEEEATRLLAEYDGEPEVAEDGTLIFVFRELRRTAAVGEDAPGAGALPGGAPAALALVAEDGPEPGRYDRPDEIHLIYGRTGALIPSWDRPRTLSRFVWDRSEPELPLTGNTPGTNTLICGLNTFNLLASLSIGPWFALALGLGVISTALLSVVPLVFSLLFFAVPLSRYLVSRGRRRGRERRALRRALIWAINERRGEATPPEELTQMAIERMLLQDPGGFEGWERRAAKLSPIARRELERLLIELDGDVEGGEGGVRYRFARLAQEIEVVEKARRLAADSERHIGEVIFSSASEGAGV